MTPQGKVDREVQGFLADKAEKLESLMKFKPGQEGYTDSLMAFLEVDASAAQAMLRRIERGVAGPEPQA